MARSSHEGTPSDDEEHKSDDKESLTSDSEDEATPSLCTFAVTRLNPAYQAIFICLDCTKSSEESCICHACAEICHAGHDVDYIAMGPAYCDCAKLNDCCRLIDSSEKESSRIGIPLGGLNEHSSPPRTDEGDFVQEAFTISSLDEKACDRLEKEATELVKHTRDTHWLELNASPDEKYSKLEELALQIIRRHVEEYQLCDATGEFHGGAEWWVQVKPVTLPNNSGESRLDRVMEGDEAVDLHYDKDEVLAESFDLGSFPALSTVTYLTATQNASPTVVFPHTYNRDEGEVMDEMLVSYPKRGKHLVFDGRLLHGAPAHHALRTMEDTFKTRNASSSNRVTFLVNIWGNRQPSGVRPLPCRIRQQVREAGKRKKLPSIRQQNHDIFKFESIPIETVDLKNDDDLPEPIRGRIELPFVSKGATWINRVGGNDLVVITFPPPPTDKDTIRVRFGPGLQAYLEYQSQDNECNKDEPVIDGAVNQVEYV
jgi:hypothetical protein